MNVRLNGTPGRPTTIREFFHEFVVEDLGRRGGLHELKE